MCVAVPLKTWSSCAPVFACQNENVFVSFCHFVCVSEGFCFFFSTLLFLCVASVCVCVNMPGRMRTLQCMYVCAHVSVCDLDGAS